MVNHVYILVGRQASGKTKLLEALGVFECLSPELPRSKRLISRVFESVPIKTIGISMQEMDMSIMWWVASIAKENNIRLTILKIKSV